jgi:hypothetical protein
MCRIAEEHRELCRQHLRLVLDAGYNPMRFFASDFKKYFYLAELYSLIDLSSVGLLVMLRRSDRQHAECFACAM